jgi:hypothetical protein
MGAAELVFGEVIANPAALGDLVPGSGSAAPTSEKHSNRAARVDR